MRNKLKHLENNSPINCGLSYGLSSAQVEERIDQGLTNKVAKTVTKSYFRIFFDNIFSFFNILLMAICIFMVTAGAGPVDFMFAYLLVINITLGIIQDIRARQKSDKLKVVSYPTVLVLRDGVKKTIPANELVLSDLYILKNGNQIVADGTILEGEIEVNESLITGESINVLKKVGDSIFSGSYVTSGTAKIRTDKVGKANYAQTLQSKAKRFKRPKSEILSTINKAFRLIGIVVIVLGVAMLITYATNGQFAEDYNKTVLNFSSSLVSMMPIGMYLLTSMTLAVGVIRLAKHRMLVQELYCIETLARVDVLCLDKTGTITDSSMSLHGITPIGVADKKDIENIIFSLVNATQDENPTAKALREGFKDAKLLKSTSSLAFNSDRKYSAVMLNDGRCFALGAREFLPHKEQDVDRICKEYERQGYRVLILGSSKKAFLQTDKMPSVSVVAVIALADHIKEDAAENIAWFKANGVAIKIISGDNPISVAEIASRVGVENAEMYVSLEGMSLEAVREIANKYTVFGRVSPEQKEVIIRALQEAKHTVAMTGDGVNDILALKIADCSIAMAQGSDAAKAVSHLVSMDSNFSALPNVVAEGRRVINNLQRTCSIFLIKTIFAMIITIIFLVASWISSKETYPFVQNNMYIWELLTIGFASFFLSLQPNNERIKNSFVSNVLVRSLPGGIIQAFFTLSFLTISAIFPNFLSHEGAVSMAMITLTVVSFATLIFISKPFDIYRIVLASVIGVLIVGFFTIDYFFLYSSGSGVSFFKINYSEINTNNWWLLIAIIVLAVVTYVFVNRLAVYLQNKHNKKVESL